VLSLALWAYIQAELNKLWRAEADPLPGQPPLPAIDDGMPPRI